MVEEKPDLGDLEKTWQFLQRILEFLFGHTIPPPVQYGLAVCVLIAIGVALVSFTLSGIGAIVDVLRTKIYPAFSNPETKRIARDRWTFAGHLQQEIVRRNQAENWRDDEFADLEAEVEGEGSQWSSLRPSVLRRQNSGIWRESSLTRALHRSSERLILLEGDPGSGRALRFAMWLITFARKPGDGRIATHDYRST